ncbi:LuxR C-terminal-related transcriptional regulator [Streptomyces sp. NPDC053431]|uniref:helix-turn-helix transcriptional regulator n=1 Tax=Streptomyces sp. NPDC053431 TaxID=3365703 RepID=UPI0037D25C96
MNQRPGTANEVRARPTVRENSAHAMLAQVFTLAENSSSNSDQESLRVCAQILLRAHARVRYLATPADPYGRYYLRNLHEQLFRDFFPRGEDHHAGWFLEALTQLEREEEASDDCAAWVRKAVRATSRLLYAVRPDELPVASGVHRTASRIRDIFDDALAELEQHLTGSAPSRYKLNSSIAHQGRQSSRRSAAQQSLTPREEQIARLVAEGLSNRATAERLSVTRKTVEVHLAKVFRKLNVSKRSEISRRLSDR